MSKFFKNLIVVISCSILLSGALILSILWSFSNNIPDYKFLKNYKPPVSSKVYSGDGTLVADFSREKRISSVIYSSTLKTQSTKLRCY